MADDCPRKKQVVLLKSSLCIISSTLSAILALGRIEIVAHGEFEVAGVEALVKIDFADVAIDGCFLAVAAEEVGAGQFDGKTVIPECFVEADVELPRLSEVYVLGIASRTPLEIGIEPRVEGQIDGIVETDDGHRAIHLFGFTTVLHFKILHLCGQHQLGMVLAESWCSRYHQREVVVTSGVVLTQQGNGRVVLVG